MTAELLFDRNGGLVEGRFYPSVIKSAARLTYTLVRQIVVERDEVLRKELAELVSHLELMAELAGWLTEVSREKPAIVERCKT